MERHTKHSTTETPDEAVRRRVFDDTFKVDLYGPSHSQLKKIHTWWAPATSTIRHFAREKHIGAWEPGRSGHLGYDTGWVLRFSNFPNGGGHISVIPHWDDNIFLQGYCWLGAPPLRQTKPRCIAAAQARKTDSNALRVAMEQIYSAIQERLQQGY